MNIGIIARPNTKGQFVIPHPYRKKLGIGPGTPINVVARDDSIVLYPITDSHIPHTGKDAYYNILARKRGAWKGGEDSSQRRRKMELAASSRRKKRW